MMPKTTDWTLWVSNGKSKHYHGHQWGLGCAHYVGEQNEELDGSNLYVMQGVFTLPHLSQAHQAFEIAVLIQKLLVPTEILSTYDFFCQTQEKYCVQDNFTG